MRKDKVVVQEEAPKTPVQRKLAGQSASISPQANAARAALEKQVGRTLNDLEWDRARARLLEFASILRQWQDEVNRDDSALLKAA